MTNGRNLKLRGTSFFVVQGVIPPKVVIKKMSNFGQQLRQIRQQKGFGLNEFAKEIGVSPAYLSNLETGKTQTIQLEVLSKLNQELHMIINEDVAQNDHTVWRAERIGGLLLDLHRTNPIATDYLMTMVEQGVELFTMGSSDTH
ncbi:MULTISPECIES: helix-turn-helix transcriptional regulator [unclassified Paenibacillus]|uniref:helix-turn-helix domain-containing protein n=1 Tax=unclassified Paenibacillus TaxID=185978 RepID=UPI0024069A76|nr:MULTISPECIES: helix-turn-helix transcriptional regulator [unclassified Paenibacillus]MDF9841767.1 transcriptional regulator with XRE-family HTH domain [Paenibacillus sp. PastF-2]MDF9848552.1 transcriptional regulator with XRE-family HTH domain [Paenibacillus sp. PastM-2]MDF9854926.1 transcriptional regulator with XRE-family HTH domain [Paenibacillus sp. PastF-1]MDH6480196.1 transcriptional regulator with XRE-family HTH domain [Paenibacillus sp. PastH-2]MDH6507820.1 transcriptional regulator